MTDCINWHSQVNSNITVDLFVSDNWNESLKWI